MVLVQHLTHTHWSAGSVGGMVLDMILYVTLYTGNSFVNLCPCQCSHFHLQPVLYFIIGGEIGGFALGLLKAVFFRPIIPPSCVSLNMKNIDYMHSSVVQLTKLNLNQKLF